MFCIDLNRFSPQGMQPLNFSVYYSQAVVGPPSTKGIEVQKLNHLKYLLRGEVNGRSGIMSNSGTAGKAAASS